VNCETDFVARGTAFKTLVQDLAMQVAACEGVTVVAPEDVDPVWVAKERAIEMEKEDLKTKPEAIRSKIVDGRIQKRVKEVALLEQPFIKDSDKTVGDIVKQAIAAVGENIKVRRFVRFNLGEGLEKRGDNFAEEVAAQTKAAAEKAAPAAPATPAQPAAPAPQPAAAASTTHQVSAKDVSELRRRSGAGMMDCKKALAECRGDIEAASEWLRKKGIVSADKKAGRIAAEGLIGSYVHMGDRLGVLVELNCETDFVARGDVFRQLVKDIAMQVAASEGVTVVAPEDVDQDWVAKEREIEMGKEDLKSKPEAIRSKIVDGRIQKRVKEVALLEQPFIKDSDKTVREVLKTAVATVGENLRIRRFTKFILGEGLERRSTDFAAEVAAFTSKTAAPEAPKAEAPKPEAPKAEAAAPAPKAHTDKAPVAEAAAVAAAPPAAPDVSPAPQAAKTHHPEAPKAEAPKAEAAKAEAAKAEAVKAEAAKAEAAKVEAATAEAHKVPTVEEENKAEAPTPAPTIASAPAVSPTVAMPKDAVLEAIQKAAGSPSSLGDAFAKALKSPKRR
jgi:elongation factor Ts